MISNSTPALPAVQNLTETGWPAPDGADLATADDIVAGRSRWRRRIWRLWRSESTVSTLRHWVWAAKIEPLACRRAQAARAACTRRHVGVACSACSGSGIDPTGTPSVRYELRTRPSVQPRCRLCGGIGLLTWPPTSTNADRPVVVDEHRALVDDGQDDGLNPYQRT